MGALGRHVPCEDHEQEAGRAAQCRRLAAQRYILRRTRPADDLDPPFLSGLFATCTERALSDGPRARGARHHGGAVLGLGRARRSEGKLMARISYVSLGCPKALVD